MTVATNDPTEARVRAAVRAGAMRWFPDEALAEPDLVSSGATRASRWYRYDLGSRRVFVKAPHRSAAVPGTDRPRILPLPDFAAKHEVEHRWFLRLEAASLPTVRAFGVVEDPPALVLDDVVDSTLHHLVGDAHRRRRAAATPDHLRSVGRWLRAYHRLAVDEGVAMGEVLGDDRAVAASARRFADTLGADAQALARRVESTAEAVAASPRAVVHGDLAPGNVFVGNTSTVRPIDPAPWLAPALLDLAYLATALRTSRAALLVPGGRRIAEPLVEGLLDGYAHEATTESVFDGLLGLALLDKWAAVDARAKASKGAGSVVERLHLRAIARLADATLDR